ncbi:MAG: WYL domain-containing protein [Acetobacteraceae bacterium]|nr:WYL domain-containing protein [Acetobacteraceae bacterium]
MRPAALRRAEPDIAALMEAEGIAMRPGPRPRLDPAILPGLRRAILGMQLVVIRYAGRGIEALVTRVLCPHGILYGGNGRAWLVAHVEGLPEMRLWRLDRIASVDLLDRCFARREKFDLRSYAAQSFGVFQEEPMDVVLRIVLAVQSVTDRGARGGRGASGALPRGRGAGDVLTLVHVGDGNRRRGAGQAARRVGADGARWHGTTAMRLRD